MASHSSQPQARAAPDFGRTCWAVVAAVRDGSEAEARRSLAALCRRYWYPVYAYARHCGHGPPVAARLVEAFLNHLVREIRASDPAAEGGFRIFLQHRLERFLAGDWARLQPAEPLAELQPPAPLEELELRQQRELERPRSAAQAFQHAFAVELLAQALRQLRQEAESGGRGAMFEAVRPYLTREPGPGEYQALAQRLASTPLATVVAVKRLRQRFQELVDAELGETVGDQAALEAERGALLALLAPG